VADTWALDADAERADLDRRGDVACFSSGLLKPG